VGIGEGHVFAKAKYPENDKTDVFAAFCFGTRNTKDNGKYIQTLRRIVYQLVVTDRES
jgi:hypothetical protein